MTTAMDTRVLPKVDTDVPADEWEWVSVAELMAMPAGDCGGTKSLNDCPGTCAAKRQERNYEQMRKSLREDGFLDPLYVAEGYDCGQRGCKECTQTGDYLSNGHHRLLAAVDEGWTHVPVTRSTVWGWEDSGVSAW